MLQYTSFGLIKQYEKLSSNGIGFSKSIADTYNELINAEDIGRDRFNYLVGRLSATMDAVAPRASVVNEIKKKINGETKGNVMMCEWNIPPPLTRSPSQLPFRSVLLLCRGVHRTPAPL